MPQSNLDSPSVTPTVGLSDVLRCWWSRRWVIALGTLGIALLIFALTHLLSEFKSEGIYQIPSLRVGEGTVSFGQMTFTDFKRISTMAAEPERLREYIKKVGKEKDPVLQRLVTILSRPGGFRELVDPQYAVTKADAKELFDVGSKEGGTLMVGVGIRGAGETAQVAQERVDFMARYLRDVVFLSALTDYLRAKEFQIRQGKLLFENNLILNQFQLKQLTEKNKELRQIGGRYPESTRALTGSVVALNENTTRFLPLPTQMIAVESNVLDINLGLERAQREFAQAALHADYFAEFQKLISKAATAGEVIDALPGLRKKIEVGRNLSDEKIRQALNVIELENLQLHEYYYNRTRFASGPSLPERTTARPVLATGIGLIGGFLIMLICSLLLDWFQANKRNIFEPPSK